MKQKRNLSIALMAALILTTLGIGELALAEEGEREAIGIELPKPKFVGTPRNIRSANLERPTGKARPPFLAPKGVENVALDMEVTASDEEPVIGDVELVTDGDKEAEDGCFVEFGPGKQWVQIDLEESLPLYAVVIWHFHSQATVYQDVVVQLSDDPDFVGEVHTIFNNDHDNSSGLGVGEDKEYIETYEGKLIDAEGIKAQYVRLYSNGNTSNDRNHYIEVEVYGLPASE